MISLKLSYGNLSLYVLYLNFGGRRRGYEFKTDEGVLGYYRSKEIIITWVGGREADSWEVGGP